MRSLPALAAVLVLSATAHAAAAVCDGISTASDAALTTVRIGPGFTRPILVASAPEDTERLFVVEQDGRVWILRGGALVATPFVDISALTRSPADGGGNEQGLLGMAFHPGYAANGWVFLFQTDTAGTSNLVVRYTRSVADPDQLDPATRAVVLTIPHPTYTNHNGGMLAFGPQDGMLYIGTGDGGWFCDPAGNAQDLASLSGKMLRIDVDAFPYAIPGDNPFVGVMGAREEIWASGLRNPWRYSFDAANGDLYIGDVGQNAWEEVDYLPAGAAGANFGWDLYEGSSCPNASCGSATCVVPAYVPPVAEYSQSLGDCAVTGGYVYRGCRMPGLHGTYFHSDYCSAALRTFQIVGGVVTDPRDRTAELQPVGDTIASVNTFGVDARGEIYLASWSGSGPNTEIYKIVPVLPALEVSGEGAAPFHLADGGDWTWEDLAATSDHPLAGYRVYRTEGNGSGTFDCVHAGATTAWTGGDPDAPPAGALFSYLVTAVNALGEETSPGESTTGAPRVLSPLPCPP